jgi:hypothetical protein
MSVNRALEVIVSVLGLGLCLYLVVSLVMS